MVSDWSAATKLLTKDMFTGEKEETKAAFDSIFLIAVVEFAHHDYRGGGVDGISTPALNAFTLYYNGDEYKPLSFKDYLQNAGVPYQQKKLGRKEIFESILVFEVKKDSSGIFNDNRAFLSVSVDNYDPQTWSLKKA